MEGRADTGVKGFFDDYGKAGGGLEALPVQVENAKESPPKRVPRTPTRPAVKTERVRARVGRPPGVANGSRSQKEKATMHINAALLDFYRDWSWEARCNLGELIERAMVAYRARRNRAADRKSART